LNFLHLLLISTTLKINVDQGLSLQMKKQLLAFITGFISENKKNKFEAIILQRTRHITLVLEDIFQPHNASAVLRSCDCFGIQDVHIIENSNKYQVNPDVALGSSKWLTLYKYNSEENNTVACLQGLKAAGYRIIATTPHKKDHTPEDLPLDQRIALVFGTEMKGLTAQAISLADGFVKIPMYGFTESLNISVSAALLLRTLTERLRTSDIHWELPDEESLDIRIAWAKNVVRKSDILEKEFLRKLKM
jgi:tRNA (guanosine-2'-O-)-methyltransferase